VLSARSALLTGVLHGLSGSGHAVGVLPAVAMPSAARALVYLFGFCAATGVSMALYTASAWRGSTPAPDRRQACGALRLWLG